MDSWHRSLTAVDIMGSLRPFVCLAEGEGEVQITHSLHISFMESCL